MKYSEARCLNFKFLDNRKHLADMFTTFKLWQQNYQPTPSTFRKILNVEQFFMFWTRLASLKSCTFIKNFFFYSKLTILFSHFESNQTHYITNATKKAFSYSRTQSHVINTQHRNKIRFLCEQGRTTRKFQTFMLIKDPFCHLRVFRRVRVTLPSKEMFAKAYKNTQWIIFTIISPLGVFLCFSVAENCCYWCIRKIFGFYADSGAASKLFFYISRTQNDDRIKTSCTISPCGFWIVWISCGLR